MASTMTIQKKSSKMSNYKGISWLQFLKATIIFFLIWVIVTLGWEGWYGKKGSDPVLKQKFGNKVFNWWFGINLLAIVLLFINFPVGDTLVKILVTIIWANALFFFITIIGLLKEILN